MTEHKQNIQINLDPPIETMAAAGYNIIERYVKEDVNIDPNICFELLLYQYNIQQNPSYYDTPRKFLYDKHFIEVFWNCFSNNNRPEGTEGDLYDSIKEEIEFACKKINQDFPCPECDTGYGDCVCVDNDKKIELWLQNYSIGKCDRDGIANHK